MARRHLNRTLFSRLWRRLRYMYLRLILVPDTPQRIARGLAVGVFVGFLPIIPVQTVVAIGLAWIFRGSIVVSTMGTWTTNPLTVPFMYPVFFYIGRAITPFGDNVTLPKSWNISGLLELGSEVALAALVGGAVLGIIFAPISYYVGLKYMSRLQAWERRKLRDKFGIPAPDSV